MSHVWQNRLALAVLILCGVCFPLWPAGAWLLPFVFAVAYVACRVWELPASERSWILMYCGLAAVLQAAIIVVWGYHDPTREATTLDDHQYYVQSSAIARAWSEGFYPALSHKGSPPYLGDLHTGYQRVLATLFLLFGARALPGILLNYACVALMPALGYLLALALFQGPPESASWRASLRSCFGLLPCGDPAADGKAAGDYRTPRIAALLCALNLSYYYWSRWLLKDVLLAALFASAVAMAVDFLRRRDLLAGLGFLLVSGFVTIMRAYAGLALFAGIALYVVTLIPRRIAAWVTVYGVIVLVVASYSSRVDQYVSQLMHSLVVQIPGELRSSWLSARYFAGGIPRLLLAPYAWIKALGNDPMYGLYPAMWVLYLVIYPLGIAGLVRAIVRNHRPTAVPLACLCSAGLVFLLAYGGDSTRQRLWLETLFAVYAGYGAAAGKHRLAAAAWYVFLAMFIGAHLIYRFYIVK
jgi:hypothetical protein